MRDQHLTSFLFLSPSLQAISIQFHCKARAFYQSICRNNMKLVHSLREAATIAVISLWVITTSVTYAQEIITECTAELQETCALDQNRTCYYYEETSSHKCGYCLNGFIEIENNTKKYCYYINDILTEGTTLLSDLLQEYLPEYADRNIINDERAERLVAVSKVVSFWNSRVPPPSFSLGFNNETFLTLKEQARRLGILSNLTYVPVEGTLADNYDTVNVFLRLGNLERFVPKGSNISTKKTRNQGRILQETINNLPRSIDWHGRGVMTIVKNQFACRSDWAIATTAAIESALYITSQTFSKKGKNFKGRSLSYQQLISCDDENYGCNGGNILLASRYSWVHNDFGMGNLGGIVSNADYPFDASFGTATKSCDVSGKKPKAYLHEPKIVTTTEDQFSFEERMQLMMAAVAQQPVTSVMSSGCDLFMNYRAGVLTHNRGCACCEKSCIDHAVVIVGYNITAATPYWKLRNSWGAGWGEKGYFRVAMNDPGCGWGLFGVLAESAIPADVYTSFEDFPKKEQTNWWQKAEGWEKALVVFGSIVGFCCLCGCLGVAWQRR